MSRLALITPVRDEEGYIGGMMQSIIAQTVRPDVWIIVDDGSKDATAEIVARCQEEHYFIRLIRLPRTEQRKPGGEGVIGCAHEPLETVGGNRLRAEFLEESRERIVKCCAEVCRGSIGIERIQCFELQNMPRIDGVGVAAPALDLCDR